MGEALILSKSVSSIVQFLELGGLSERLGKSFYLRLSQARREHTTARLSSWEEQQQVSRAARCCFAIDVEYAASDYSVLYVCSTECNELLQ